MSPNDKFLLSKGHGCLALYAVMYQKKYITREDFFSFTTYNSILGGHPDRNKSKYIEISAGSLGHGLPIAIGMCLSNKIKKQNGRIYCLIGDGEANEGTTWESLLMADNLKLNNLVCIVDNNNSQVRALPTNQIRKKFESFGFDVKECAGHDLGDIEKSLNYTSDKPICVVCDTIKGYGIEEMQNNMHAWHHGPPNERQYNIFINELERK